MSADLTPEAARAAADWLGEHDYPGAERHLRAEADRLEAAARTPGQVAYETWGRRTTAAIDPTTWDDIAAAVAVGIGPDRVVVNRFAALNAATLMAHDPLLRNSAAAIREALS